MDIMTLLLQTVLLLTLVTGDLGSTLLYPGSPDIRDEYNVTSDRRLTAHHDYFGGRYNPEEPEIGIDLPSEMDEKSDDGAPTNDYVDDKNHNLSNSMLDTNISIMATTTDTSPTDTSAMSMTLMSLKAKQIDQRGNGDLVEQRPTESNGMMKVVDHTLPTNGNQIVLTTCKVSTVDPEVYNTAKWLVEKDIKLLEYNINFPKYGINPLMVNMSNNFMSYKWSRAFSTHGRTLLTLSFNYAVLSMTMLSFGVENINVDLIDEPNGCFGKFTAEQKLAKIMLVVMSDFRDKLDGKDWVDYACHQTIQNHSGVATFQYQCYEQKKNGERLLDDYSNITSLEWISIMFVLIRVLKVFAFFTGPIILYASLKKENYIVKLEDLQDKSIMKTKDDTLWEKLSGENRKVKFQNLSRAMKDFPLDEIQLVSFRNLLIEVDYRWLMNEKFVPVGLFRFFYSMIIFCGIRHWQPFLSCCKQSICGSWSTKFLCCSLRDKPLFISNFSWNHLFKFLGGLLLLIILPVPYYIRIGIYYYFEQATVIARQSAVSDLQLRYPLEHTLLHVVDPTDVMMIGLYSTYGFCFILLAAFRHFKFQVFECVAMGAVRDMHNVNQKECIKLFMSHVILPFEKFGICGGFLVGIIYWPLALPICIIVSIIYSVPTLYLLGRFLIHAKPRCHCPWSRTDTQALRTQQQGYPCGNTKHILSDGTDSLSECFLLQNISPNTNEDVFNEQSTLFKCHHYRNMNSYNLEGIDRNSYLHKIVGVLCSVFVLCVLILSTDLLGFIVEVFMFTLMGAIVNASSASKYIILAFWIMIYSSTCFNNVYNKYMMLNRYVFQTLKSKLESKIIAMTILRADIQQNTAFKYFEKDEFHIRQTLEKEVQEDSHLQDNEIPPRDHYQDDLSDDALEYKQRRLNWRIHNLVLFLDSHDEPYIPRRLFYKICDITGPGCPGPIHLNFLKAFQQLSCMITFFFFILITVMTFAEACEFSSTNQLLLTLAGGFIPSVVRFFLKLYSADINLNSYSFRAKLEQIIYDFDELWPVTDFSFKLKHEEALPHVEAFTLNENKSHHVHNSYLNIINPQNIDESGPTTTNTNTGIALPHLGASSSGKAEPNVNRCSLQLIRKPSEVDIVFHEGKRRLNVKQDTSVRWLNPPCAD